MKRGPWVGITCLLAGLALFLTLRPADPSYNGKTLNEYIDRAASGVWARGLPTPEADLKQAVSHLGTRALPILVRRIGDERWLNQSRLFNLQRRLPRFVQGSQLFLALQRKVADDEMRAQSRSFVAARALASLGTNAQPAISGLMRLLNKQNSFVSFSAREALQGIGRPALPEILKCFSEPGFANSIAAVQLIGTMQGLGEAAASAVPVLCNQLRQGDPELAKACADTLAHMHVRPELAVPALSETLKTAMQRNDVILSRKCAEALGTFGVSASNAVPVLCAALKSTDGITTEEAARALGQIGAREDLAVPALIDYLKDSGSRHRRFAIEGLSGYNGAVRQVVPLLQAALNDADHDTRAAAQQALARIGLYNKEPLAGQ